MFEIGSRLTVTLPVMGKAEVKMLNGKMISTRIPRDDSAVGRGQGLRPTMLVLIAALCAEGTSTIGNIRQIDRGYERIDERLHALGAVIERTEL
jgi:UDP-N-acetylglucosamine enolpyruvyl transferase